MPTAVRTHLRCYERIGPDTDAAARWLQAAEAFPEAMPRRFGGSEPLEHRFDREGAAGFVAAARAADGLLFLQPSRPAVHGSIATPSAGTRLGEIGAHSLVIELQADDPRLRAFACGLLSPRTVFVSLSLEREPAVDDRGFREPYLAPLGRWLGLPPDRPPWCWFGAAYTRALRRKRVPLQEEAGGAVLLGDGWVPEAFRARPEAAELRGRIAPRVPRGVR